MILCYDTASLPDAVCDPAGRPMVLMAAYAPPRYRLGRTTLELLMQARGQVEQRPAMATSMRASPPQAATATRTSPAFAAAAL